MPTYRELRLFVEHEGWEDTDAKAGRPKGDHHRYTLELESGEKLYTRISHGRGSIDDPNLFAEILRMQLRVTEDEFWDCVRKKLLPPRPGAPQAPPERTLDGKLAMNLIKKVGLTQEKVSELDQGEAVAIWQRFLTEGAGKNVSDP